MNELIIVGFVGGLLVDAFQIFELRSMPKEERPDHKQFVNLFPYFFWPFLGAFLVWVYGDNPDLKLNRLLSLQIGASSPLIFRQIIKSFPIAPKKIELEDEDQ